MGSGFAGHRGVALGIVAFVWTETTLAVLVLLFAAYVLVTGVFALLQGVLGVGAGIIAWRWPSITVLVMVYLVALWAILTGVTELAAAWLFRRVLRSEWLLVAGGVISILFALILVVNPKAGAVTVTYLFGIYALISGAVLLALALRLRGAPTRRVLGPLA